MKRITTIFIALLILLQSTVFAYTDITDNVLNEKVEVLTQFGIINGYEDGSFHPYNGISRAEFSKMIMCTIMQENQDACDSSFADVQDSHWAKNYIYTAKELNIVNGTSKDTFAPEDGITNEQAVKMIVSSLGYREEAESAGGYPKGYIDVAKKLNIIRSDFIGESQSTRAVIAEMIYNSLDVEFYLLGLNEDGEIERSKSESTLREYHEFLCGGSDNNVG